MRILLVSATKDEIDPIARQYGTDLRASKDRFFSIRQGTFILDILISGIGSAQTTFHLTNTVNKEKYDVVLNVGIAGSFAQKLTMGEIVNVKEEEFADFGTRSQGTFKNATESGFIGQMEFPFIANKITNKTPWGQGFPQLKQVRGITVETIIDNFQEIDARAKKYSPDIETMEGAAFFYVMSHQSIPYYQIRSISNIVGSNKMQWNIPLAKDNLCRFMLRFIDGLKRGITLK
ncbi:MAG: hypothetical protein WCK02_16280 [Bacteroidota bacterium]